MSTRLVVVLSGVLALCSCGTPRYTYAPVRVTSADVAGQAAAMYPVPPEDPLGDVRVTTFGMARLFPEDDDGAPVWAIHVALVVTNHGNETWWVDGTEQSMRLESGGALVSATDEHLDAPKTTVIPAGTVAWVHLFFPLESRRSRYVPGFEVRWTVRTERGARRERTTFERFVTEPRSEENEELPVLEKDEAPNKWSPSSPVE